MVKVANNQGVIAEIDRLPPIHGKMLPATADHLGQTDDELAQRISTATDGTPLEPADPPDPADAGIPRPKVQRLARRYTVAALRALVSGLHDSDPKIRHVAAVEMLNRGWGKAPIVTDQAPPGAPLTGPELEAEINRRLAALAAKYPGAEIVLNPSEVVKK